MLSKENKEYFRKLLSQRLEMLSAEADRPVSSVTHLKEESRDFVDQASMGSDTDFTFRLRERESRLILKVIEALERLDQGVFGICEECDREISVERLKARPIATLCIECKRAQEASEKVRGAQLPSYE